jgi:hypothetical protein
MHTYVHTHTHASSGIRNHDPVFERDSAATGNGYKKVNQYYIIYVTLSILNSYQLSHKMRPVSKLASAYLTIHPIKKF